MITFTKLNETDDSVSVTVGDKMFIIIKRNDTGISIDYYNYIHSDEPLEPFKSDQIWFDDLTE
jgi:hypothetical protein